MLRAMVGCDSGVVELLGVEPHEGKLSPQHVRWNKKPPRIAEAVRGSCKVIYLL